MNSRIEKYTAVLCAVLAAGTGFAAPYGGGGGGRLHRYSTTVEKERPQLNEETRRLIAVCRRDPSPENLAALRKQIAANYDKVVARKKAKLEELKQTARHQYKVDEMRAIVDEMVRNRESRIEQSMRRFTDPRLRPGSRNSRDGFLPVLGAARNVSIARTPVTNEEYAAFLKAAKRQAPAGWRNGTFPAGKGRHPVVNVTFGDAQAYCRWLSAKSGGDVYRLPTAEEWELAAGHMPKDADFNCGEREGTSPVDAYAKTQAACGAVDMWGNCWEWTGGRVAGKNLMAVKGGSWRSPRAACRTEQREEGRAPGAASDDLGFRVVRER